MFCDRKKAVLSEGEGEGEMENNGRAKDWREGHKKQTNHSKNSLSH